MPELRVLSGGRLKLPYLEWKDFFAQELTQRDSSLAKLAMRGHGNSTRERNKLHITALLIPGRLRTARVNDFETGAHEI
jgi:hypothetical protein